MAIQWCVCVHLRCTEGFVEGRGVAVAEALGYCEINREAGFRSVRLECGVLIQPLLPHSLLHFQSISAILSN